MLTRHHWTNHAAVLALLTLSACATTAPEKTGRLNTAGLVAKSGCEAMKQQMISGEKIGVDTGLKSGVASIDSAVWTLSAPALVAAGGPTPSSRINPATPNFCKILGRIKPVDPTAPDILFQINFPESWNGRSLQLGGGGFNGVLINGLALPPAARWDLPAPLAQGFMTVGTDSGHQNKPGEDPQAFAANAEAFANFAHAAYKKVRDVSVAFGEVAYGRAPDKMYFMGSSEGGREGLMMAQRYPAAFDGIFSRVPVVHWTGLMHASHRVGLITAGDAWLPRDKVELVHNAVLATCDALDGIEDGLVANPVACKQRFDVSRLQCSGASASQGSACLSAAQVKGIQTHYSNYQFAFALANGQTSYPGWGVSGEGTEPNGPTGGWSAWFVGRSAPTKLAKPDNGINWVYGSGAIRHIYMQNPGGDALEYQPQNHQERVLSVSGLMDATNPDLTAFQARGGKLIMLEYMADYAQSPYAGIGYYESVVQRMGKTLSDQFIKLYAAPGVDHVGTGAPANVDALGVLTQWVEQGRAPAALTVVDQELKLPFAVARELPLCEWPSWPRYRTGNKNAAVSFECVR